MLKIRKHTTTNTGIITGKLLVPGSAKKITGVAVINAEYSAHAEREVDSIPGYRIRLSINNKEDNVVDNEYHDGYLNILNNVNDNKRYLPLDCKLKSSSSIDYIITYQVLIPFVPMTLKLYLRFE